MCNFCSTSYIWECIIFRKTNSKVVIFDLDLTKNGNIELKGDHRHRGNVAWNENWDIRKKNKVSRKVWWYSCKAWSRIEYTVYSKSGTRQCTSRGGVCQRTMNHCAFLTAVIDERKIFLCTRTRASTDTATRGSLRVCGHLS